MYHTINDKTFEGIFHDLLGSLIMQGKLSWFIKNPPKTTKVFSLSFTVSCKQNRSHDILHHTKIILGVLSTSTSAAFIHVTPS